MFFLILSFSLWAQTTTFHWIGNSETPLKGKCYEVDSKTMGQQYSVNVSPKKCRPAQTHFSWVGTPEKGFCVEIDSQTGGQNFIKKSSLDKCFNNQTQFKWNEAKCYAIGENFIQPTKNKYCAPEKTITAWKPSNSIPMKGSCYEIDEDSMGQHYQKRVDPDQCKPTKVKNIWFKKRCYEVDAKNGPQSFSKKIADKKCKKGSTYKWLSKTPLSGNCFEISQGPDNDQIVVIAPNIKCKPKETRYVWQSIERFKGNCIEVDAKLGGENYAATTTIENCRPPEVEVVFAGKCYQVDSGTKGRGYAKKISPKECSTVNAGINWIPKESGWGGSCYHGVKKISSVKCKPAVVSYKWYAPAPYEGHCYEYDSKIGHLEYSRKENPDKCMPAQEHLTYQFIKTANKFEGSCHLIDKRKPGLAYHKEVQAKHCKELLK